MIIPCERNISFAPMADSESSDYTTSTTSGSDKGTCSSSSSESSEDPLDWEVSESSTDDSEDNDYPYPSTANPSEVKDFHSLFAFPPGRKSKDLNKMSFGKWMIFRSLKDIDEMWHKVRIEVESGVLIDSVLRASCSTMLYNPTMGGPGPLTSAVIIVHTTEDNANKVGYVLIAIAGHDIKYKTDEASAKREYSWTGEHNQSVCLKTLYWNNGNPSLVLEDEQCHGPRTFNIKDEWHINHVTAPEAIMSSSSVYGRWVIEELYINLTGLWHTLKEIIEEGVLGPVEMVCPPKKNRKDPKENPVFFVYTACENKERVGLLLATVVEKDIRYELSRRSYRQSFRKPVYNHRIIWDEDEPVYKMSLIQRQPSRIYYRRKRYTSQRFKE